MGVDPHYCRLHYRCVQNPHQNSQMFYSIFSSARFWVLSLRSLQLSEASMIQSAWIGSLFYLSFLTAAGGQIKGIQSHTMAREPAENYVSPLSNDDPNRIASVVTSRIPASAGIYVSCFSASYAKLNFPSCSSMSTLPPFCSFPNSSSSDSGRLMADWISRASGLAPKRSS